MVDKITQSNAEKIDALKSRTELWRKAQRRCAYQQANTYQKHAMNESLF